jgi:hypothetical protein
MTNFVRILVTTMCHIRCHLSSEGNILLLPLFLSLTLFLFSADQTNVLKGTLPPSQTIESEPPILTAGMSAGITYRAWEVCGSPSETPTEATSYNPFLQSPVNECTKVKLVNSSACLLRI